jgi:hypothetical protein
VTREALLVLGPHRGGTSSVAGLLVRLGADAPRTLMAADADNPAGYWESAVLCEFHERLLHAVGTRWDAFTRLAPDRLRSAMSDGLGEECRRVLRAEFGDSPRFVLKDPRMCRLVPFWLHILEVEGIVPAAVLVLRSPGDVARSLAARNEFEPDLSLLIWLRHVLDAESDTRAIRRTFVRYHDVLESWPSVAERLGQDLPSPSSAKAAADGGDIDRFVNRSLCHHRGNPYAEDVAPMLADWTRRAWDALGWLHEGDPSQAGEALSALDSIRAELDRSTAVLGDVRDRVHRSLQGEVDGLRSHATALESARQELQHRIEALEREADLLRQNISALQQNTAALQQNTAALQEKTVALQRELSAALGDAETLRKSASWRVTAPLRAVYRMFR